jgi:hypothetical protein
MQFIKEKMRLVLNQNDDFLEEVYNNKGEKVKVNIYEQTQPGFLSKNPIAFVELDYDEWKDLDDYSYLSDACFEDEILHEKYKTFMEKLINKINEQDLIKLF